MKFNTLAIALGLFSTIQLTGCGGSDSSNTVPPPAQTTTPPVKYRAVIAGTSNDYSSSDISITEAETPFDVITGYNEVDQSDYALAGYGQHYYRIGKYNIDNLTKYDVNSPNVPAWQYSTNATTETNSGNPYALIFLNSQKAYLLRYGSSRVWIVNPSVSANDEANFKIGEIDLSAYDDGDGSPEPANGVIADGKLFISMQRIDNLGSYAPGTAYVAVIDTSNDTEIDTNTSDAPANLKGIQLAIKNPQNTVKFDNKVFIAAVGNYGPTEYTGGIQSIDTSTYALTTVLDDGDETTHPYGQINGVAIVSATLGYFRGYAEWQSETLYSFNPSTGVVNASSVNSIENVAMSMLVTGPNDTLWVGIADPSNPHITVLDSATNTEAGTISLKRDPVDVFFVAE